MGGGGWPVLRVEHTMLSCTWCRVQGFVVFGREGAWMVSIGPMYCQHDTCCSAAMPLPLRMLPQGIIADLTNSHMV